MNRPKTIFCDLDGTLVYHEKNLSIISNPEHTLRLLPGTSDVIKKWDEKSYWVVITTGRKESLRYATERQLRNAGIVYNELIMGFGGGLRILLNDKKQDGRNAVRAVSMNRDDGLDNVCFDDIEMISKKYFETWENKDLVELSRLFSKEISIEDWNGSCNGIDEAIHFNKNIFEEINSLRVDIEDLYTVTNTVVAKINIFADGASIPVVDIVEFDNEGKIKSIKAYRGN